MIRLYTPDLRLDAGGTVRLTGDRHHYLGRVLRGRRGDAVELFDGSGDVFRGEIVGLDRQGSDVRLDAAHPGLPPAPVRVRLLQVRLRGGRTETVIQKATELGVDELQLVDSHRSQGRWEARDGRKLTRLQAVAVEAAEQCGRAEVPVVQAPLPFEAALATKQGLAFVLWEEARHGASLASLVTAGDPPAHVTLLSGPEGGLSGEEAALAQEAGFALAGLGPRILRAETAPLAALALLQGLAGDLRDGCG